jgi:two-component system, sensor histidine kinase and response regulator
LEAKTDKSCVLVVEDEKAILEFLSRVLKFEGYTVYQAGDGEAGLKILKEQTVDMVILDLQLPVRDGFSLLEEIKSQPALSPIPVMILSASAEISKREKAYQLGARCYATKPISIADLKESVAGVIGFKKSNGR